MNKLSQRLIKPIVPKRLLALTSQARLFKLNNSFSSDLGKHKDQLIFKIQVHEVKPEFYNEYREATGEQLMILHQDESLPQKLVGSFRVMYGAQDEVIHIWRYDGGYASIHKASELISKRSDQAEYRKHRARHIHRRRNQLLVQFGNMPDPLPRSGDNIYELRTYQLKAGSIGEWHHNWANIGQKCRDPNELVTGLFTNSGPLNLVQHLFCYKDLTEREKIRNQAWLHPRWGEHVRNTTPLINHHESRILKPMAWSPLQ